MTSDERAEAAERVGDDLLSPDTVKFSAGLDAATSVEAALEAADDVVQFAGFGSLPAAAPAAAPEVDTVRDRVKALSDFLFATIHRLMNMVRKAESEKALLRRAGKRALEAASASAAQLARARTENERLRGLLNAIGV